MSLSTRRPPGIPSSVRPPRSASTTRGREPTVRAQDDLSSPSNDNRYRTAPHPQRSRSVPRQGSDNPFRSQRMEEAPPIPSNSSRHSAQSSVSSSSSGSSGSGSSVLSAASTTPSSLWDYVGWKGGAVAPAPEQEERIPSPEPLQSPDTANTSTLWSRVAAVTGGLSVSVGKAWESKDDLPEPDTPPGRDSRVTTALKKHYIKQVNDPRQLPSWLFSDIERQVGRSYSRHDPGSIHRQDETPRSSSSGYEHPTPARSRPRHDDTYASAQPIPRREQMRAATYDDEVRVPTRAATRLRAMRDARRGPPVEREAYPPASEPVPEPEPQPILVAPPRPRVGLPARPGRPRRE